MQIIKDALANSFIAPCSDDANQDDRLTITEYNRTKDEEDEWGLTDFSEGPDAAELNTITEDAEENGRVDETGEC